MLLLAKICYFVQLLLIIYFLGGIFPLQPGSFAYNARQMLGNIFEPILNLLRKYIPPIGRVDMSGLVLLVGLWLLSILFQSLSF